MRRHPRVEEGPDRVGTEACNRDEQNRWFPQRDEKRSKGYLFGRPDWAIKERHGGDQAHECEQSISENRGSPPKRLGEQWPGVLSDRDTDWRTRDIQPEPERFVILGKDVTQYVDTPNEDEDGTPASDQTGDQELRIRGDE